MANTTDTAPGGRKAATGGTSRAATSASDREQDLEAQVAQLRADLKGITETLAKVTGDKAGEVKDLAKTELRQLKRRGQDVIEDVQDQAGEYEKQLKDMIREKPLTAVASALGVGFVLALLTRH